SFIKLMKHLRKEQQLTEVLMNEVKLGVIFKRAKKETRKDEDLKAHLLTYDKTKLFEFFDKLMVIFETDKNSTEGCLPAEERRNLITVQDQEQKNMLIAVNDASTPEEALTEKDELLFLRADQSHLKFQLSQKDEQIKILTDQLSSKKSVQFANQKKTLIKKRNQKKNLKNLNPEKDNKNDFSLSSTKFMLNKEFYKLSNITDQSILFDNAAPLNSKFTLGNRGDIYRNNPYFNNIYEEEEKGKKKERYTNGSNHF
ncbi:unnamed protein product, partial [Brachionus calyciflorus]